MTFMNNYLLRYYLFARYQVLRLLEDFITVLAYIIGVNGGGIGG